MASRMLRRSGIAVGLVAETLGDWKADTIYQVGIGQYYQEIDVLLEEWGDDVLVFGCEPHPDITKGLAGKYPGLVARCAIGDKEGTATLYSKRKHKDGSSLYPHKEVKEGVSYDEIEVQVTTLDKLFPDPIGGRILLWMDCEGNELAALRGGEKFIKRVEIVNIELTSCPPCEGWCSPVDVHDWLVDRGFYLIGLHTHRISSAQCDGVYVRGHLFNPKYCSVPPEITRWRANREA